MGGEGVDGWLLAVFAGGLAIVAAAVLLLRRRRAHADDPLELLERAAAAHEDGRDRRAMQLLGQILLQQPTNAYALLLRTRIRLGEDPPESVARELESTVLSVPNPGGFAILLARAFLQSGEERQARRWYEFAKKDPDFENYLSLDHNPGELQMRLGGADVPYA